MTIEQRIESLFEAARGCIGEGDPPWVDTLNFRIHINEARAIAAQAEVDIRGRLAGIRATVRDSAIERRLKLARRYSEKGNVAETEMWLRQANYIASQIEADIGEKVGEIESACYQEVVLNQLASAREHAEKGFPALVETHLKLASEYAQKCGVDINQVLRDTKDHGYKQAVSLRLSSARTHAEEGAVLFMETDLKTAEEYVGKCEIKKDIISEMKIIRTRGYTQAIPSSTSRAKDYAEQGCINQMECSLRDAERWAQQYKVKIEKEDFEQIRKTGYRRNAEAHVTATRTYIDHIKSGEIDAHSGAQIIFYLLVTAEKQAEIGGMDITGQVTEIKDIVASYLNDERNPTRSEALYAAFKENPRRPTLTIELLKFVGKISGKVNC